MNISFQEKKTGKKLQSILFCWMIFSILACPIRAVHGQITNPADNKPVEYTLLEPLPCIPGNGVSCTPGTQITSVNFKDYVQYIFNLVIALAAVAAVFMIVWGGFKYTSTDSFSGKSEGKDIIFKALQGLLLVLTAFLILKTIDPRLVEIPTTLVKPLDINVDVNLSKNFFEQMAQAASKYHAEIATLQQQIQQTQQNVTQLEAQKTDLIKQQEAAAKANDALLASKLSAEIQAKELEINNQKARLIKDTAAGIIKAEILKNTNANSIKQFNDAINAVNAARDKYNAELVKLGSYEEQKAVNNEANYAEATITLMKLDKIINETTFKRNISFAGAYSTEAFYPSENGTEAHELASKAKGNMDAEINKITKSAFNLTDTALQMKLSAEITATKTRLNQRYQDTYKTK